ncbi:uncharacterized protein [Dermacentor albipictus]|uniref:uncharacterized protein n=1 Tax=Dermacentor albipictus TaxID=60249 RepID=UPI0038FCA485
MNGCVLVCSNGYTSCPAGTTFHGLSTHPCFVGQRQRWITAVRRKNADGRDWEPSRHTKICSVHFIAGAPSNDVSSPSYVPTIFLDEYRKLSVLLENEAGCYARIKKRRTAATTAADLARSSSSLSNVVQAAPPTATIDVPASPAPAVTLPLEQPEGTDGNNEPKQLQGVECQLSLQPGVNAAFSAYRRSSSLLVGLSLVLGFSGLDTFILPGLSIALNFSSKNIRFLQDMVLALGFSGSVFICGTCTTPLLTLTLLWPGVSYP